ncbi:MAG: nitrate/sulfonate/bicarbonate transporter substrate-binding protein [Rhodospirillales bacterium]|nr:nitrate/sulfonate/bicarbonate transporter substrate-binding protein [Rhodospirillales bacterium]
MLRRLFQAALITAALALASSAGAAFALDKVKVGKSSGPMILAMVQYGQQAQIWETVGLEVESVQFAGEAQTMQSLASGSIEFGFGSGAGLAYPVKGVPASAVAAVAGPPYNLVLVVRPDSAIRGPGDLKGKIVGVTSAGSLTDWSVHELSRQMGWGHDGIEALPTGASRAGLAALKTGEIDGLLLAEGAAFEAQDHDQVRILLSFGDYIKSFHANIVFAANSVIARDPALVERFLKGWFRTVDYVLAHPDFGAKVGAETMGISEDAAQKAFKDEVVRMTTKDGSFDPAAIEVVRRTMKEMGVLETVPEAAALYSTRFVPVVR